RATPHSSSFPSTTSPLHTLHMDVWGRACVSGQGRERYFLLVVDDYTRYTTVFLLRNKVQIRDVLIPCIRAVRLQLYERFRQDFPILRLHSERGGEFSSDLLQKFRRGEGILHSFTLPASPQKNGIAERRISLVMEVARTSMIHAAAPHSLWPFALFLASSLVFPLTRRASSFTNPPRAVSSPLRTSRLTSRFPFTVSSPTALPLPPPPPLFLAPCPPPVDSLPPHGPAPLGVSLVDPLPGTVPVEVAVDSGAARGAMSGGAASGGAQPASAEPGGAELEGAEPGAAESRGAKLGGAKPGGAEPEGVELGGAESEGVESGGVEPDGAKPGDAESGDAESGGAEPRGTSSSGGYA
ncbi:unnamed protein product, partial [Closterium sp. NIES-54]